MLDSETLCLCGSNQEYYSCCLPYHNNTTTPATAELLMRSRFTAYAMQNESYLLESWGPTKKPVVINFSKDKVVWTKLEIVKTKKGKEKDSKGVVEFKAYYLLDNVEYVMNEISRFKKLAGRWLYLDGLVKGVGKAGVLANQRKNAPCPCDSGKKFKRCCGN